MAIISSKPTSAKVETPKDLSWAIACLKEHLLKYEPENLIKNIKTIKDIYQYRYTLKQIDSSSAVILLVTDLVLRAIQNKTRFRTLDCLKVLRSLIKQLPKNDDLSEDTLIKLFEIYKHFVFSEREDVQWCVSSIIKDKVLGDEAVDWLVRNHMHSKHIINRLLLYPYPHPKIKSWAEQILSVDGLPDRRSDLLALLIDQEMPKALSSENYSTIQWAIFKSRIPRENKINLLKQYSDFNSIQSIIEITDRLEAPEILHNLVEKLEGADAC